MKLKIAIRGSNVVSNRTRSSGSHSNVSKNTLAHRTVIAVTPQHARRFLRALADNIERYERSYGEIEERNLPGEVIQFGGPGGEA